MHHPKPIAGQFNANSLFAKANIDQAMHDSKGITGSSPIQEVKK